MRDSVRNGALAAVMVLMAQGARAQGGVDSVGVSSTPGGSPYLCCFDFTVFNRHDASVAIPEVRFRIVSGRGEFQFGTTGTPANWTIDQDTRTATWSSGAAAADIRSGASLGGFHICARDTGVIHVLWETRTLEGVLSSGTLALACRGVDCDQAFFQVLPSGLVEAVDIDLIAGNPTGRTIDDFHLHLLTPGASFLTAAGPVPTGWIRLRARADTLSYGAQNGGLARDRFAEGFRVQLSAPQNSPVKIEWWSTSLGEPICRDTVTLRFSGLARRDTVRFQRRVPDSCCVDFSFRNTHAPASGIDLITFKVISPGVGFRNDAFAPDEWEKHQPVGVGDSIFFTSLSSLEAGDSALFESLCFDNVTAASDTIRYRWESFFRGAPVDAGTGETICLRPLTACDSVEASPAAAVPGGGRCISLRLMNRNSRSAPITRFVVHISNPGARRAVLSATAPAGWQVESAAGDSAAFKGGALAGGSSLAGFSFCVSGGDASTRDPLSIAWSTAESRGALCSETIPLDLILSTGCDSAHVTAAPSDSSHACFSIALANPAGSGRGLDSVRFQIGGGILFSSASGDSPWHTTATLPAGQIALSGGTIAPGASGTFSFCLDTRTLAGAAHLPLIWTTFGGGSRICIDTVDLSVTPSGAQPCDSVRLIGAGTEGGSCVYDFAVVNLHLPASVIDGVQFRITGGAGGFGSAQVNGAPGWLLSDLTRAQARFRGLAASPGNSISTFHLAVDSSDGHPLTVEICTYRGDVLLCCMERSLTCGTASVSEPSPSGGPTLLGHGPDPTSGHTVVRYLLSRPGEVRWILHDGVGREVRREVRQREESGAHAIDLDLSALPSGIYYCSLSADGGEVSYRVVIVK